MLFLHVDEQATEYKYTYLIHLQTAVFFLHIRENISAYKDRCLLEACNDEVWRSIGNIDGHVSWPCTYIIGTNFREILCLIYIDATVDHRDPVAESDAITARSRNDVIIRGPFLGGGHTQKSLHATRGSCWRFHSVCRDLTHTLVAETQWKHAKCWANGLLTAELQKFWTTPLKAADTRVVWMDSCSVHNARRQKSAVIADSDVIN